MIESLLGGLFGGIFRILPEVFKLIDAKDSRKHELDMLGMEMEFAKIKYEAQMHAVDAEVDRAQLDSIGEALKGQAEMAVAGGKFVSAISALVRPLVTYWVVTLWSAVKIAMMLVAYQQNADWKSVLIQSWTADDMALFMGIISFWFISRVVDRNNGVIK